VADKDSLDLKVPLVPGEIVGLLDLRVELVLQVYLAVMDRLVMLEEKVMSEKRET
jgi:hypothetical protein